MHPDLQRLAREGIIRQDQANYIHANWDEPSDDLWAQPWVRALGEHTKAYIDLWRGRFQTAGSGVDQQEA